MSFTATITTDDEKGHILKLFKAEQQDFKNKRSNYTIKEKDNKVVFEVTANDATALRSTLDSIAKGLKIYEDMKDV